MNKKIIFFILGGLLSVFALCFIILYVVLSSTEKLNGNIKHTDILLNNGNSIYVKTANWGLAGNHNEISLSEFSFDEKKTPNKQTDYVFYTSEIFYKEGENGKVFIFAPQSGKNIPEIPFKNIEVIFKGLKTADEIRDYETNYRKYGLQRISIYDKDG